MAGNDQNYSQSEGNILSSIAWSENGQHVCVTIPGIILSRNTEIYLLIYKLVSKSNAATRGAGCNSVPDDMLTIAPFRCFFISGITRRDIKVTAPTFTLIISQIFPPVCPRTDDKTHPIHIAYLYTMRPVASGLNGFTQSEDRRTITATSFSSVRDIKTTLRPCLANSFAYSLPIPSVAPNESLHKPSSRHWLGRSGIYLLSTGTIYFSSRIRFNYKGERCNVSDNQSYARLIIITQS
uniref:Uncharacterized protein n=1 Tax=Glossina pallidipes TaxID=7398 RepID=A0A1A9ZCZ4_GLOPL